MKRILSLSTLFATILCGCNPPKGDGQVRVSFQNNSADVCHFGIAAYMPGGKLVTRVSNVAPYHQKSYSFPVGTALYLLDREQEATVMQGTSLKERGDQPRLVLARSDDGRVIRLD